MLKYRYAYEGPVLCMDRLVSSKWSGETVAVSEKQARNNLAYQFKKKAGLSPSAKVTLVGKLRELETIME